MGISGLSRRTPRKLTRRARRHLPALLISTGALLLGYAGYQYSNMYLKQHRLGREWRAQQELLASGGPGQASAFEDELTRISVPAINLDAYVVQGSDRKALSLGPGHMENTVWPGEIGNSVIAAHRDTFFHRLYELQPGDTLTVQRRGRSFTYEVTGKSVVPEDDMSVVRSTRDAQLTLITCYPTYYIGPAPKRLVVFSRLIKSVSPQVMAETSDSVSPKGDKLLLKRAAKAQ